MNSQHVANMPQLPQSTRSPQLLGPLLPHELWPQVMLRLSGVQQVLVLVTQTSPLSQSALTPHRTHLPPLHTGRLVSLALH